MNTFWKVFVTVIITAGVIGGGGYYYMSKKATNDKNKLQSQIDDLNKQITDLKAASTSSTSASTAITDETASWKTYTNSTYAFSFKYPTSWEARDITSSNSQITNLKLFIGSNSTSSKEDTGFNVQVKNTTLTDELAKVTVSKKEVQKFGITATAATSTNSTTGFSSTQYYIGKSSLVYIISGEGSDTSANARIGNKIVSTFQFTN